MGAWAQDALLTPSEVMLLTGGITAKGVAWALAEEVYAAAFVALESAGTLALERFKYRQLLFDRDGWRVSGLSGSNPWPEASLEADLVRCAERRQQRRISRVRDIVYDYLGTSSPDVPKMAMDLARGNLEKRGLLRGRRRKILGFIPLSTWEMPPETQALAARLQPALQGILDYDWVRPGMWKVLRREIALGLRLRDSSN
jgi:hypothetical protein